MCQGKVCQGKVGVSYSSKVSAFKPMVQGMTGYGSITGTLTSILSLPEGEEVNKRERLSIGLHNNFVNWMDRKQHCSVLGQFTD